MKKSLKTLLPASLLALLLVGCGADKDTGPVAVRIGPTNSYQVLSVAQQTGILEQTLQNDQYKVEWKGPFAAFAPTLEAANANEVDVGSGGLTNYIMAVANGAKLVVIGVEDISASVGIVATAQSGIKSVADLVGKRVAVNKGGTGEYLLLRALEKAGIDPQQVERVYLSPNDSASAFSSNNVDAWATWDQYFAGAQVADGANVLVTGKDIDNLNWTFHWVTKSFADAHPDLVKSLTGLLVKASEQSKDKPEIVASLYQKNGATPAVVDKILSWPLYTFFPVDEKFVAQFRQHAEDLKRYNLIDTVPDLEGTYYTYQK